MRNRIPCQRDAGTRLATALRIRPFPRATKEIGDVCTQATLWKCYLQIIIYLFIYLFTRWYNLYFIFQHFCHAWRSIDLVTEASSVWNFLACVASVSKPKNERVGMGRGRKETLRDKPLDSENPARQ